MAYTKTTWVDNSTPAINATNLNKIESGIETNDLAIADLKPKLLWTNSNLQPISTTTINLSSSDYDMLLVIFLQSYDANMTYSAITSKGNDFRLIGATTTGTAIRLLNYVSDTQYSLQEIHGSSTNLTNGNLIPLYIIGFKTGLF